VPNQLYFEAKMKTLLIEDDLKIGQYIVDGLKQNGHNPDWAKDGMEGLFLATEQKYDVIIADRMLPKIDGIAIIQTLRNSNIKTPVLILSSLDKVEEIVKGLKAGGDDYLTKPFSFAELSARLESLMRRNVIEAEQTTLKVDDLEMNLLTRTVTRRGKAINLQNREFRLLEFLIRRVGQVVTRTMLLEGVWDYHFDPQTNIIDAQISKLRNKIDKGYDKALIQTIRGTGYKIG
jgi:two-component system OmpR family response regulator